MSVKFEASVLCVFNYFKYYFHFFIINIIIYYLFLGYIYLHGVCLVSVECKVHYGNK